MGSYFLIAGLACLVPLIYSVARNFVRSPESISTPAWLNATNALFILGGPVFAFLFFGEDLTTSPRGAMTVVAVMVAYAAALALSYYGARQAVLMLSGGRNLVVSAVANLKHAAESTTPTEVFIWSAIVIGVQIVANYFYSLGLSGGNLAYDHRLHVPYVILAVYMLFGQASLGLAALLGRIAFANGKSSDRGIAALLLFVEFVITVLSGRRELLWLAIAVTFGIVWSGRRRWAAALPFAAVAMYLVLFLFGPVFLRARLIYSGSHAPGIVESYRMAIEEQGGDVLGKGELEAQRNTSWRFRTFAFWEELYADRGAGFTEGKILVQAALLMLPRAIVGHSKYSLGVVDENLLETKFDICNNVGLESYIDVGTVGPLVYGLIFGVTFALADALVTFAGSRNRIMAVLAAGSMLRHLFGPEANPIGYFSVLRTCLMYALLAILFTMVVGRKPFRALASIASERLRGGNASLRNGMALIARGPRQVGRTEQAP